MLVFGDGARTARPDEELAFLLAGVKRLQTTEAGLPRHDATTFAFIEAAELAQGIVDAVQVDGVDTISALADAAMDMVMVLANALGFSWDDAPEDPYPAFAQAVAKLQSCGLPAEITCKQAEGYAFYALYPESYVEAARTVRMTEPLRVVGIRSIGLGLAALVAASAQAGRPLTVRPVGHPFRRELALSTEMRTRLAKRSGDVAVVDEGPGLSGSSFGTVLDTLEDLGVAPERIHVFPSHAGDLGPEARPEHQARWHEIQRHVVDFDSIVLNPADARRRLDAWFTDVTGRKTAPLQYLSGGAWRALRYTDEAAWPPVNMQQERRKYLLRSANGPWLLKFAGLGRYGTAKLRLASHLADAGFIPRIEALHNGFSLERWLSEAEGLDERPMARDALVDHLGRYLGFRVRSFPASSEASASLPNLGEMLQRNASLGLTDVLTADLRRFCQEAERLQGGVRRISTDNKLHRWEWLRLSDGRLMKADALDHAATHDLVGCQDIAWDIAGAVAEFDLSDSEAEALVRGVEVASGQTVDPNLLRFLTPCYLAFHLGAASLARDGLGGIPAEAERLAREVERYRVRLSKELARLL